jgi:uncharacterized protein YgbK (DUF1537 family)
MPSPSSAADPPQGVKAAAPPKLAFYGDDFTGASDTVATLAQAGLHAILFCGVPTPEQFRRAGPLDAFGIAGAARSMPPDAMRAELCNVGPFLSASGAPVLHYKCCSTFDSAPQVGSIGVAVETLRAFAPEQPVLIVGGQPSLGRYCLFGELFAVARPGGAVYRIDRHPTMSRHPVTPMQEADLRIHLGRQGLSNITLVDVRAYEQSVEHLEGMLAGSDGADPARTSTILFDVAADVQLAGVGRVIWTRAQRAPLLVVGASSVAQALIDHWRFPRRARDGHVAPARGPVLVLAGSLSPITARQIATASAYAHVTLAPDRLVTSNEYGAEQATQIATLLRSGRHVVAHTTPVGQESSPLTLEAASRLAPACGLLLRAVLEQVQVSRVGIAGGDTSSHAVQALAAWGLEWLGQIDAGVPLLRVHADDRRVDGLELMLKGGQMGGDDLFEALIGDTKGHPATYE